MNKSEHSHHENGQVQVDPHAHHHGPAPVQSAVDDKATQQGPQLTPTAGTIFTCPMHPEIRRDQPGSCPKCGMTLEPLMPALDDDENPELADFQRRFWWTLPLTVVSVLVAMLGHKLNWFHGTQQSWV